MEWIKRSWMSVLFYAAVIPSLLMAVTGMWMILIQGIMELGGLCQ